MNDGECQHPPQRVYTWWAYNYQTGKDDILCAACCDCGAVLAGGADVPAPDCTPFEAVLLDLRALAADYPQHVAALVRVLDVVVGTLRDWETGERPYPYGRLSSSRKGVDHG